MRIGLDASPLVLEPRRGVARMVEGWIAGLKAAIQVKDDVSLRIFEPGSVSTHMVVGGSCDVFLSPWSAFPRLDVPAVVTVHELPFVRHGPVEGRFRAWRHKRWLRRDVEKAAAIVVPSNATRDDVLTLHPHAAARVFVVPNGFDPAPWEAAGAAAKPAGHPYGVIVGARSPRKGVGVWTRALPLLRDLDLDWIVVGEAPTVRGARIRVEREPDDARLHSLVAGARLLVYPSLSEGFGYPPLEAMAAGVPVVSTTAGSIPEVAGDAACLVPPGAVEALAQGIRRVATDEGLRADLIAKGHARAKEFSQRKCARKLILVLRRAMKSER